MDELCLLDRRRKRLTWELPNTFCTRTYVRVACRSHWCQIHVTSRLLEWFRLSLRFGWIGSETRYKKIFLIVRRNKEALASTLASRIRRGLQLPYGRQAHRRGWAPTADVPPPKPKLLKPLKT